MVDIVVVTKTNPSKELKAFEKTILDSLAELGSAVSLVSKTSAQCGSLSCGKDFTMYIGYDHKILSHFFAKLEQDSFFVFLAPAGDSCEAPLGKILENCADYMDCDSTAYKKMASVWSYKEAISYVKQRISATAPAVAPEATA